MEHQKRNLHSTVQRREINPSFALKHPDYLIGFLNRGAEQIYPTNNWAETAPETAGGTRGHTKREEPELESHRNTVYLYGEGAELPQWYQLSR